MTSANPDQESDAENFETDPQRGPIQRPAGLTAAMARYKKNLKKPHLRGADDPVEAASSRPPVQEPVDRSAEPAPARVVDELAFAPGCFGSALYFDANNATCRACHFSARCQSVHQQTKDRIERKFGTTFPTPESDQPKTKVLSRADLRRLQKNESYHRRKAAPVRTYLRDKTPEEQTEHRREKERLKKARQRAEAAQKAKDKIDQDIEQMKKHPDYGRFG